MFFLIQSGRTTCLHDQDLESTAFAHSDHVRDRAALHFHLEFHNRCEVRLKPNLWDKGAYFVPNLFGNGALRVVPHFVTKHERRQIPQKRSALPIEPTKTSLHQYPRIKGVDFEHLELHVEAHEADSDVAEQDTTDSPHRRPAALHAEVVTPLPNRLNAVLWRAEYERHKQTYNDIHGGTNYQRSSRYAHRALIDGEFGIYALTMCDKCTKLGRRCRVYHPECYKWGSPEIKLGWRCSKCRSGAECVFSIAQASKTPENHDDSEVHIQPHAGSLPSSVPVEDIPSSTSPRHNQHTFQTEVRDQANSVPRNILPLPLSITQNTWMTDFEAIKKEFIDNHNTGGSISKSLSGSASRFAHQQLMNGKYGVRAVMACEHCSDAERECRTYHPECYGWQINGLSAIHNLGWRCSNCRYEHRFSECNVQWQ